MTWFVPLMLVMLAEESAGWVRAACALATALCVVGVAWAERRKGAGE